MKAKFFQLLEEMNKADPRFTVYAKALLFYYMPNQGELFITHNWYIADLLGIHENTLLKAKKELVTRGVIFVDPAYSGKENNRRSGTYVTVNYDWKASNNPHLNKLIQNKVIENKVIENKVIENKLIQKGALIREKDLHREKDLPRENDPQGKDLTREKAEGAAAKPQPAPALSEGTTPPPEKAASQESSFPETAQGQKSEKSQIPLSVPEVMKQGQTDLFGEAAPLPGKPKKDRKAKPFTPPTKEEVRLELESLLAKKETIQQWSDSDLQFMTELFFEHYNTREWRKSNGEKLKNWQAALNTTWLLKQGYLPDRTTRNQPQREGKQIFTAEQLEKLAAGSTDPQQILEQRREWENQKGNVITIE
ncbi:MAG: hypothetical protein VZR11_09095 [Succinimonas sp.]|nr:hypothetical protein [Succinimonas sp.]